MTFPAGIVQVVKYPGTSRLVKEISARKLSGKMSESQCRITSLYVQRLWFMPPWLTHGHTDSFWPALLLAQLAELEVHTSEWCYHKDAAGALCTVSVKTVSWMLTCWYAKFRQTSQLHGHWLYTTTPQECLQLSIEIGRWQCKLFFSRTHFLSFSSVLIVYCVLEAFSLNATLIFTFNNNNNNSAVWTGVNRLLHARGRYKMNSVLWIS